MLKNLKDITINLANLDKSLSYLALNYSSLSKVENTEELLAYITQIEQDRTRLNSCHRDNKAAQQ